MISDFLRNPGDYNRDRTSYDRMKLFQEFILIITGLIILSIAVNSLLQIVLISKGVDYKELTRTTETINKSFFKSKNFWFGICKVILIAPILEEIMYRLPLSLKKQHVLISSSVIILFFVGDPIFKMNIFNWGTQIKIILTTSFIVLAHLFLKIEYLKLIKEHNFFYILLFYGLAFNFAWGHSPKLLQEIASDLVWLKPIFIIPQFGLAIAAGYLRLRYGFIWGILLHVAFNTPATLVYTASSLKTMI